MPVGNLADQRFMADDLQEAPEVDLGNRQRCRVDQRVPALLRTARLLHREPGSASASRADSAIVATGG